MRGRSVIPTDDCRAARPAANVFENIATEFAEVLRRADVIERLAALGIESAGSNPEEFSSFFRAEVEKWATVIKTTGISAE